MKKIYLLFLFLPMLSFSQSQFSNLDSLQFRKAVDQIITDTGIKYQEEINRQDWDENNLKFVNPDDEKDKIFIVYGSGMAGGDKDLEIEGVKKWYISTIYAKYLRIFELWKKYADPNADKIKLNEKGFMMLDKFSITRIEKGGAWRMHLN